MKRILTASLLLLAALSGALAQSAPANLPYHSVYGRIGAVPGDVGPGQAITFEQLASNLFATTPTLRILKFLSASGRITELTTGIHVGAPILTMPSSSGEMTAWITPQYIGFRCDGTQEAGIIQHSINNLPASGGVVYLPPGSDCVDTGVATVTTPNVKIVGAVRATGNGPISNNNVSKLKYTGTAARYIDARSVNGFGLINVHLTYSSSSFTGSLIDVSSNNVGVSVGGFVTIEGSFLGPDTNRTGAATLLNMGQTVDAKVDSVFFYHGAPAILGAVTLGQNTVATIRKSWFSLGDGVSISGCGESWTLEENSFEPTSNGAAFAFATISSLPCRAMVWKSNWFGDATLGGGTWISVWANGFEFSGNMMSGDIGSLTNGISLNTSTGVHISGNDFDYLSVGINCNTAVAGINITGNRLGGTAGGVVTTKLANPSNCTNITTEGNTPSISRFTSGQILVGQSGADAAPKTMSGDATIAATGAVTFATVNSNTGAFGDGTHVGQFTVNAKGQITAAASVAITGAPATTMTVGTTTVTSGTSGRVLYDNAGGLGEYTTAQLTAQINAATASLSGALPAWPNNTTTFFRGDGSYAAVAASGLSGATLASGITASSLTSFGSSPALATPVITGLPTGTGIATANTVSTLVARDGSGNFSAGTITAALSGNAATVTTNANLTGPVTSVGNATSVTNNAITYAMMQQAAGVTLIGVTGSATANLASITATDINQIMRVNTSGNAIGWGSINLASDRAVGTSLLPFANGGLNASLTASNGGIFYSTASAGAILAGTATARQMLQSGASTTPAWSTTTWPATTTVNRLLWSSAANVISDLATANNAVLTTDGSGVPSLTAAGQLPATATNDSAAAGKVGEYVESVIASGSAVALTSITPANVTSISLTAGDWDVDAVAQFTGAAGTTVNYTAASLSTTSATFDVTAGRVNEQPGFGTNLYTTTRDSLVSLPIVPLRFSLSSTTTVYLVAQSSFAASTSSAFGLIRARRVR